MTANPVFCRLRSGASTLAVACALAGCVTINIYFPAAAAERAADRIIDEVWQLRDSGSGAVPDPAQPAAPQ